MANFNETLLKLTETPLVLLCAGGAPPAIGVGLTYLMPYPLGEVYYRKGYKARPPHLREGPLR